METYTHTTSPINESHDERQFRLIAWNTAGTEKGLPATLYVNILLVSKVKINNVWKEIKSSRVKINRIWKKVKTSKIKVNGNWKDMKLGRYVYVPPTEKVINGTFTSNTTGWVAYRGIISSIGGELYIENTPGLNASARQIINVVKGEEYTLSWKHSSNTQNAAWVLLGSSGYSPEGDNLYNKISSTPGTTYTKTIVATTNEMYIQLKTSETLTPNSGNTKFDNISIMGS